MSSTFLFRTLFRKLLTRWVKTSKVKAFAPAAVDPDCEHQPHQGLLHIQSSPGGWLGGVQVPAPQVGVFRCVMGWGGAFLVAKKGQKKRHSQSEPTNWGLQTALNQTSGKSASAPLLWPEKHRPGQTVCQPHQPRICRLGALEQLLNLVAPSTVHPCAGMTGAGQPMVTVTSTLQAASWAPPRARAPNKYTCQAKTLPQAN